MLTFWRMCFLHRKGQRVNLASTKAFVQIMKHFSIFRPIDYHHHQHVLEGSKNIVFLDVIRRPDYISKHNVSETGFRLRLQVKPTQAQSIELVPISGYLHQSESE
jgi:urease beta subunit